MYSAKVSPPTHAAAQPRTASIPALDAGFGQPTHRSRGTSGSSTQPLSVTTDEEHTFSQTQPLNGHGRAKHHSYLYQSESPRGKSKASRCCGGLLDGKHAHTVYIVSLLINVVLLIVILTSFLQTSPLCLHESQPPWIEGQGDVPDPSELTIPALDPFVESTPESDDDNNNNGNGPKIVIVEPVVLPPLSEDKPVQQPVQPVAKTEDRAVQTPQTPVQPPEQQQQPPALEQPSQPVKPSKTDDSPITNPRTNTNGDSKYFGDDASDHEYNREVHETSWNYCLNPSNHIPLLDRRARDLWNLTLATYPYEHCTTSMTSEQSWQIGWYGGQVAQGVTERVFPFPQQCVHLPPIDYQWPAKYTPLPAPDQSFLHWPNLRVNKFEELIVFNPGTPKNLYHFDAPKYDLDGLDELALAATYIPFASKVRNFLDIGAGGASLGLVMRRKYKVETISVIFPDWPYCEYISERGGLCVLVDVMEAMPFARHSFDVVHISWVYHGQKPHELVPMFTEIDRLVRPGGYVWQRGGWSMDQIYSMKHLFARLGYVPLLDKVIPKNVNIKFGEKGDIPFEAEWSCIYVKPIRAVKNPLCSAPHVPELAPVPVVATTP